MKKMNCVSTMPEIMPEITDEAIIEALFAQRPYEEKVINSAYLEIPAEYQRKLMRELEESLKKGGSRHSPTGESWTDKLKRFFSYAGRAPATGAQWAGRRSSLAAY